MDVVRITDPPVEPITLAEAKLQCGFGPMEDSDHVASRILSDKLRAFILTARMDCENYTRRAFVTQTWAFKLDHFPGRDWRYLRPGYAAFHIPKPPVQSIDSFQYVDVSGQVQTLLQDTSYGTDITQPQYGYQFVRGSETQPGQLVVSYPRIWPPTRMVPANVLVQARCGYGGPLTVSTTEGSAAIAGPTFNPDDAPLLTLETGLPVSIPGAGANGATLNSFIAAVDGNGNATLKNTASATVTNVTGWFGRPVPEPIRTAVKFMVKFYYDGDEACRTAALCALGPYRNMVA